MNQESQTPKAATRKTKAAPAPKTVSAAEREEAIRAMAYTLYEARGCIGGHELEDWLRAEALVAQASAASPAAEPAAAASKPARAAKTAGTAAKKGGTATKSTGTAAKAAGPAAKRAPAKARTP